MTTIIINDKTTDAQRMIEFLRTQRYARIIEEKMPNASSMKTGRIKSAGIMDEIELSLNQVKMIQDGKLPGRSLKHILTF
jgi:hypothetical protein